jgi:hypothetical protein
VDDMTELTTGLDAPVHAASTDPVVPQRRRARRQRTRRPDFIEQAMMARMMERL